MSNGEVLESHQAPVRLTRAAQRDVLAIRNWTRKKFGKPAAARYEALIEQAVEDIGVNPERKGSSEPAGFPGVHVYHLTFSRNNVAGARVREPRHFLLFRRRAEGFVEVGRILHDSFDLEQHLPKSYRRAEGIG